MNSYLRIADAVLRKSRQPLSAREILDAAYRLQLVPGHLYGKTQHKTLHARLAEDLLYNRRNTLFARSGAGRFGLRSHVEQGPDGTSKYIAPLRSYQLKQFDVVCANRHELESLWTTDSDRSLFGNVARAFCRQRPLDQAERDFSLAYLCVLVTIRSEDHILTLTALAGTTLKTGRALGMFGYLKGSDATLFSPDSFGIDEAARRTISEQSTAPKQQIDDLVELIDFDSLMCLQFIDQDEASNAVVISTAYDCEHPDEFLRHVPSHRSPRWTRFPAGINNIDGLEPISRRLLSDERYVASITGLPPQSRVRRAGV